MNGKRLSSILCIDTTDNSCIILALEKDGKRVEESIKQTGWTSQALLPFIDRFLNTHKIRMQELTGVEVARGPGSFTGLRVGVAVANILGWIFQIPVNGIQDNVVEPIYK